MFKIAKRKNIKRLNNVSLCTIMRDEIYNPAGGIEDFIHSTLPYVEQAVIVDTGSVDSTWDKLQEFQQQYTHLRVFQKKFNNFADMRNYALSFVTTKMVLILDADERLTARDFKRLAKIINTNPDAIGFKLRTYCIYKDKSEDYEVEGHHPRLFKIQEGMEYRVGKECYGEYLYLDNKCVSQKPNGNVSTNVKIKHFCLGTAADDMKVDNWYELIKNKGLMNIAPSTVFGFSKWTEFNPRRNLFR